MGNRVDIFLTKFVDLDMKGGEAEPTYGLRVCDDNDMTYTNGLAREEVVGRTPAEIVELARGIDDRSRDMIGFAEEMQEGIHIGDAFFAWSDIRPKAATP